MQNINKKNLNPLTLFKFNIDEFIEKYGRDRTFHSPYIYLDYDKGGVQKLNNFGYYQLVLKGLNMTGMLNHGYAEYMKKFALAKELVKKTCILKAPSKAKKELIEYLNNNVNKPLDKSEQEKFKFILQKAGLEAKAYSKINNLLRLNGYRYKITTERKRIDGIQQTLWNIKKV